MSSLLEAANASQNKIEVTDKLPEHIGDISIMTIEQAFKALENSNIENESSRRYDPTPYHDASTYCVYGIAGKNGEKSTIKNLQDVSLDLCRQVNVPTFTLRTFESNCKTIFGGPLCSIWHITDDSFELRYGFEWGYKTVCMKSGDYADSDKPEFWDDAIAPVVCIAVVRVRE